MSWASNIPSEFGSQSTWPDGSAIVNNSTSSISQQGPTGIKDLWPQTPDVTLIGIVLAKQCPRAIKNQNNNGGERSVMSFTLRDSPVDYINVSCWGRKFFINELARKFKIGDIVKLQNPQIMPKSNTEMDERCRPWTPSHFQLSFSERYSSFQLYGGWDTDKYSSLVHMPIQDSKDFHNLGEILSNGQNLSQQHVNILAMIKHVSPAKDITTKTGNQVKRCEVKLLDETCPSLAMIMWDDAIIDYAQQNWIEKETVIFAVDILAKFDDFRHTMTLTADRKTIFVTNPDTKEAHSLYKYGKSVEFDDDTQQDVFTPSNINISTIKDVYNAAQLQSKLNNISCQVEYGLMFAFLSSFDIDGPLTNVLSYRCASCKFRLNRDTGLCSNSSCASSLADTTEQTLTFDMRVSLSDHTGTVAGTYLTNNLVQEMLGCTVDEFMQLPEARKTDLKWSYLLEKCKVYFKVVPSGFNGANNTLRLLACERADPKEVYNNFKLV